MHVSSYANAAAPVLFYYCISRKIRPSFNLSVLYLHQRTRFISSVPLRANGHVWFAKEHHSSDLANHRYSLLIILEQLSLGVRLIMRTVYLATLFGPLLLAAPLVYLFLPTRNLIYYFKWTKWTLAMAGPAFTKLGQWAATRPDVLPAVLCSTLAALHSRAPVHSLQYTRFVLERELGRELEGMFEGFEDIPVGSGSVAQVYKAQLTSGLVVAVKVTHPDIHGRITRDLLLLKGMAAVLHRLPTLKWLNLPEEVDYFAKMLACQTDLRFEAATLARFGRNFENSLGVAFPKPIGRLCTRNVLVETFEEGLSVDEFTGGKMCSWSVGKKDIATAGLQAFLRMLLWDNFVHADLHPGNIIIQLVKPTGRRQWWLPRWLRSAGQPISLPTDLDHSQISEYCRSNQIRPRIVFLDTGLVTELSRRDFRNFSDLFIALVLHGNGYEAAQLIIDRAPGNASRQVINPEEFCEELDKIIAPLFRTHARLLRRPSTSAAPLPLQNLSVAPTLYRVFELVRAHHVRLDAAFTNLVMSLICVEGLGHQLAPQMNLLPFLAQAGLQYLATEAARSVTETVQPYL